MRRRGQTHPETATRGPHRARPEEARRSGRSSSDSRPSRRMPLSRPAEHLLSRWSRRTSTERASELGARSADGDRLAARRWATRATTRRSSGDTRAFNELVDSVDFPKFVADLLKAVFDANLKVMKQQTDAYIKLMKEATKSTADFIKKVKDDESFAKLAETKQRPVQRHHREGGRTAATKLALTEPAGRQGRHRGRRGQAGTSSRPRSTWRKEHRAALREVLLMGVTRLVVEKGEIEAGVEFSIKATRESTAQHEDQNINVATVEHGVRAAARRALRRPERQHRR